MLRVAVNGQLWIYVFMLRLLRGTILRQRERLLVLIWHLGMGAESWIFLHVGKWELHADMPGTKTPAQSKSGKPQLQKSWFHDWNWNSYQSVCFQIFLVTPWLLLQCKCYAFFIYVKSMNQLFCFQIFSRPSVLATSTNTKTIGNSLEQSKCDSADV